MDQANAAAVPLADDDDDDDINDNDDDNDDDESSDDEWEDAGAAPRVKVAGEWVDLAKVDEDMTVGIACMHV
jgi:hypothetical protein